MQFGCTVSISDYHAFSEWSFDYVELSCKEIVNLDDHSFHGLLTAAPTRPPVLAMNHYCPPDIKMTGPAFDLTAAKQYATIAAKRAKALGVKKVGIGSPLSRNLPEGYPKHRAREQFNLFLRETADVFGKEDICLCLEALSRVYCNFVNRLDEAHHIVDDLTHPYIQLLIDFYNMEHEGEADQPIKPYNTTAAHAHISDDLCGDPMKRNYLKAEKATLHQSRIRRLSALKDVKTLTLEIDTNYVEAWANHSLSVMENARL